MTLITVPPWILYGKIQLGFSGASQSLDGQVKKEIVRNILMEIICLLMVRMRQMFTLYLH